jgi:signal transduction histidine kinase
MNMTAKSQYRILCVEDSELDYELMIGLLSKDGARIDAIRVETGPQLKEALADREWDAVISDHNLPGFSSGQAFELVKASGLDLPFIIVSGEIGEDVAVAAMQAGADDYLIKGRLKRLPAALDRSIEAARVRAARRAAAQALETNERRLRELAIHMQQLEERERAAIAREVHDDIGGNLAAAKFSLARLRRQLSPEATVPARPVEMEALFADVEDLISRAVDATRSLLHDLRPSLLDQGIVAALEWQVADFARRYAIKAHFEANRTDIDVPADTATALYRICQEALTNVARHAHATEIDCVLFASDDELSLEVRDNGIGFDPAQLSDAGRFGLLGVRERVSAFGGSLEVISKAEGADRGTTLLVTVPIGPASPPDGSKP